MRNRARRRSGALPRRDPLQSLVWSMYAYVLDQEVDLSLIPSERYMPESRDSPRRKPRPQTDIFQNPVRKGNVTWSALDILDFSCIVPEAYSSCGNLPRSRSLAVGLIPHITLSPSSRSATLLVWRSHHHSIERMRKIEKFSFLPSHSAWCKEQQRGFREYFFSSVPPTAFLDKFLSLTHWTGDQEGYDKGTIFSLITIFDRNHIQWFHRLAINPHRWPCVACAIRVLMGYVWEVNRSLAGPPAYWWLLMTLDQPPFPALKQVVKKAKILEGVCPSRGQHRSPPNLSVSF